MDWIDKAIRDLCELPDRSSPADDPEAVVATPSEIRAAIEANRPQKLQTRQEKKMNKKKCMATLLGVLL